MKNVTPLEAGILSMLGGLLFGAATAGAVVRFNASRTGFHKAMFEASPTPMYIFDSKTLRYLAVNKAAIQHYGYTLEEFLAMTLADLRAPEEVPQLLRSLAVESGDAEGDAGVFRHRTKDGRTVYAAIRRHDLSYRGAAARLVHALDVTALYETEARLRESEATMQLAQEVAHLGSCVQDYQQQRSFCSDELCRMLGVQPGEIKAGGLWDFDHPDDAARIRETVERAREERRAYKSDHRVVRRDGVVRHVEERGYWTYDENGEPARMFATILDITERKNSEATLAYVAFHDPVTNLLNRTGLRDHLARTIKEAGRPGLTPVFFFDLDRFKTINDTLGHVVGDQLIVEIAHRLASQLRPGEVLARTGGDEFIIVTPPMPDRTNVSMRARQLLDAFSAPFTVAELEHTISASMGISVYPMDAQEPDALLRSADVAMYAAKGRGGATFHYYTADLQRSAEQRFRMESALRRAIDQGEFRLHYQPVVCARTGRILAVEALLRWNDPFTGPVAPSAFIPLAEETGFIRRIGAWVFEHAVAQAKHWASCGTPIQVWVNVSAAQLHDASLPQVLADLLRTHELDGSLIGLELTESSFINHERDVLATLNQIRALKVRLALDDFGVKYSSLEYLQRLPIDTIKVDRVFVTDIASNAFNASIVRAIVSVAHDVGFHVTAEGIESPSELAILKALGCDAWQGYLFSAARPPEEIDAMMGEQVRFANS